MELRLFNRGKDIRFVRPHRIALLEWVRAVRHNLYCELTLMWDKLEVRFREYRTYWKSLSVQNELFPEENPRQAWQNRLINLLNGAKAAQWTKQRWNHFRTQGVGQRGWMLIFILGLMIGFGIKTWAGAHITIGYDDYKLDKKSALYDLNALKIKVLMANATEPVNPKKEYPGCTLNK